MVSHKLRCWKGLQFIANSQKGPAGPHRNQRGLQKDIWDGLKNISTQITKANIETRKLACQYNAQFWHLCGIILKSRPLIYDMTTNHVKSYLEFVHFSLKRISPKLGDIKRVCDRKFKTYTELPWMGGKITIALYSIQFVSRDSCFMAWYVKKFTSL
jgi:hypothetical protein